MLVITAAVTPGAPCSEYHLPEGDDCNNALFTVVVSQRDLSSRGVYSVCPQLSDHFLAYTCTEWILGQFKIYFANISFDEA